MMRVGLQGEELAVCRKLARHPDGAIAAEGADLQDPLSLGKPYQQGEKLTLIGGDIVCREPGTMVVFQYPIEHRIAGN